jgi:hypothetical protein
MTEGDRLVALLRDVARGWREDAQALDAHGHASLTGRAAGAEWAADEVARALPGIEGQAELFGRSEALAAMMRANRKQGAA